VELSKIEEKIPSEYKLLGYYNKLILIILKHQINSDCAFNKFKLCICPFTEAQVFKKGLTIKEINIRNNFNDIQRESRGPIEKIFGVIIFFF
jgi:hypothetical protein